jgi:hypothetical protein
MAIVVTVPHATEPAPDQGAVLFTKYLQSIMTTRDIDYYIVNGDKPKAMIPLSTYYARGTDYNTELSVAIEMSELLIEVQSFGGESDSEYTEWDFVIGDLPDYSDDDMTNALYNYIDDFGDCSVEEVLPKNHYPSVLSEFVYEKPAIIINVNENVSDKFMAVAERLVDFAVEYAAHRTSMARSSMST